MSSYICASIRIGGRIKRAKVESLRKAICDAALSLEWGDAIFLPRTPDDLMEAKKEKWLELRDERADHGEFPELEALCRKLGVSYLRHCEACFDSNAERADWRPGMKKPVIRVASNVNCVDTYVPTEFVQKAITLLEAGHVNKARLALKQLCPNIPDLPPFEVI